MKLFTAALILIVAVWYVATKTTLLNKFVSKDVTSAQEVIPKAERAASRERARVNQVQSVESAGAGQTVTATMTRDEVRSVWGEPNSIEHDAARNEIWHYESIGKKVTFRDGRVWLVEGL